MLDMLVRTEPSGLNSDDSPRSSFSGPTHASPLLSGLPEHSPAGPTARIHRLPSLPDILPHAKRLQLIDQLDQWGFNALELDANELWECASIMFETVMCMEGVETGITMGLFFSP